MAPSRCAREQRLTSSRVHLPGRSSPSIDLPSSQVEMTRIGWASWFTTMGIRLSQVNPSIANAMSSRTLARMAPEPPGPSASTVCWSAIEVLKLLV